MNSHHFQFPPPPPPPPPKLNQDIYGTDQASSIQNNYVVRGNRSGRSSRFQGRGNLCGAGRGGYRQTILYTDGSGLPPDESGFGSNRPHNHYSGDSYLQQKDSNQRALHSSHFRPPTYSGHGQSVRQFQDSQHHVHRSHPAHAQPNTRHRLTGSLFQNQADAKSQFSQFHNGLPIQCMSFKHPNEPRLTQSEILQSSLSSSAYNHPAPSANHRGQGQKRSHANAFSKSPSQRSTSSVAPAVPIFGGPLPLPPQLSASEGLAKSPKQRERKHNQLGLTPKVDEYESSEGEEDVDEESRLAAAVTGSHSHQQPLQITYKDQIFKLQSPSDIANWIAERKKRFPTKASAAKAAEEQQRHDELKRTRLKIRRGDKDRGEERVKEREKRSHKAKTRPRCSNHDGDNTVAKARLRVEKLRRQLKKEERKIIEAEFGAKKPTVKAKPVSSSQSRLNKNKELTNVGISSHDLPAQRSEVKHKPGSNLVNDFTDNSNPAILYSCENHCGREFSEAKAQHQSNSVVDPLTPIPEQGTPNHRRLSPKLVSEDVSISHEKTRMSQMPFPAGAELSNIEPNALISDSASDMFSTDSEDLTSSSGSSSSETSSEEEAPEQLPSKVIPPKALSIPRKENRSQICRSFLKGGRCKFGVKCRNRHQLPDRGTLSDMAKDSVRNETDRGVVRVSLYQRLVAQEKEEEERAAAINHVAEEGVVDNPDTENEAGALVPQEL